MAFLYRIIQLKVVQMVHTWARGVSSVKMDVVGLFFHSTVQETVDLILNKLEHNLVYLT